MLKLIIFDWNGTLYNRTEIFAFTKEILKYLKPKYKLALISKANPDINTRKELISSIGLNKYFDKIIIKHDKTISDYNNCIKSLNEEPKTTAIIDDRTRVGIKIGNKLGCTTFWINQGKFKDELPNKETGNPTYIIESIKELKNYL